MIFALRNHRHILLILHELYSESTCRSSPQSVVSAGPTVDFIASASSTQEGGQDITDLTGSAGKLPQFVDDSFQPLFEAFFTFIHGTKVTWMIE